MNIGSEKDSEEEVCESDDDMESGRQMPGMEYFTADGLHKVMKDPTGLEKSKFYIISHARLVDLALQVCASCSMCHLPVHVDITSRGTSPHISWVRLLDLHTWYLCNCNDSLMQNKGIKG